MSMAKIEDIRLQMKRNPTGIRYNDLCKVCDNYFGKARQTSTRHRIYKTPWQGDPRINIKQSKGMAKAYEVKQVLMAIQKLEDDHVSKK